MYHYVTDRELLGQMRRFSGEIMQALSHELKVNYHISTLCYMVGSARRNLITQNENNPIDIDYNLEIVRCEDYEDTRTIRMSVHKALDKILRERNLLTTNDSTSAFSTKYFPLKGSSVKFKMDIAVVCKDETGQYYRLIHKKETLFSGDEFYWAMAPDSKNVRNKAKYIKDKGCWSKVRKQYLDLKNMYLRRNDHDHPSFICYIEAVNNVYNEIR